MLEPFTSTLAAVGDTIHGVGVAIEDAIIVHTIVRNLVVLVILGIYDKVIVKHLPPKKRWFRIHAFANALAVITALNSCKCTLVDPLNSLDSNIYSDQTMFGNASASVVLPMRALSFFFFTSQPWI